MTEYKTNNKRKDFKRYLIIFFGFASWQYNYYLEFNGVSRGMLLFSRVLKVALLINPLFNQVQLTYVYYAACVVVLYVTRNNKHRFGYKIAILFKIKHIGSGLAYFRWSIYLCKYIKKNWLNDIKMFSVSEKS